MSSTHLESPYKKILFCTDFSKNADFAFDFALDGAHRRPGCVLYILHVVPEPDAQFWNTYLYEVDDVDKKAHEDMEKRIRDAYLDRVPSDVHVKVEIRTGKDYQEILGFARDEDIDLIIMGRHGANSLGKMLFGEVTEKITRKAECAVLVIPLSFEKKVEERRKT